MTGTRTSSIEPRTSSPRPRPGGKRGGRRPGAGAKPGNLNALKTGKGSKRVLALRLALQNTETAAIMRDVAAADEARVITAARSLYHVADLMLISRGLNPSKICAQNSPSQLQNFSKFEKAIRRSNAALSQVERLFPSDLRAMAELLDGGQHDPGTIGAA